MAETAQRISRSRRTARACGLIVSAPRHSLDIGTTENLVLNANDGDDVITAGNGLRILIHLTIDGGAGNDIDTGGDGNDRLLGAAAMTSSMAVAAVIPHCSTPVTTVHLESGRRQ